MTKDEDADFDESEASADSDEKNNHAVNQSVTSIRRETKMLEGIAKYLIPVVGHGVERLNLSQSRGLNNAAVSVSLLPSHGKNETCLLCGVSTKALPKTRDCSYGHCCHCQQQQHCRSNLDTACQAWNLNFERARPFSFCKGHFQ